MTFLLHMMISKVVLNADMVYKIDGSRWRLLNLVCTMPHQRSGLESDFLLAD